MADDPTSRRIAIIAGGGTLPLAVANAIAPVANTRLYVLDRHLQPVPDGIPGELCIGGDGVADGYLHQPEVSADRFRPDPFHPGGRIYRTGDLVRRNARGELEFLGRHGSGCGPKRGGARAGGLRTTATSPLSR